MEAPKQIFLQICGDCKDNECSNCKFTDLESHVTWCIDKIFDKDIEYIRADAFIEKAAEWLKELGSDALVEDFKNYMKGE